IANYLIILYLLYISFKNKFDCNFSTFVILLFFQLYWQNYRIMSSNDAGVVNLYCIRKYELILCLFIKKKKEKNVLEQIQVFKGFQFFKKQSKMENIFYAYTQSNQTSLTPHYFSFNQTFQEKHCHFLFDKTVNYPQIRMGPFNEP
ncbi:hypothetical protein RFI_38095, partial [Reticulomyxa filosa]